MAAVCRVLRFVAGHVRLVVVVVADMVGCVNEDCGGGGGGDVNATGSEIRVFWFVSEESRDVVVGDDNDGGLTILTSTAFFFMAIGVTVTGGDDGIAQRTVSISASDFHSDFDSDVRDLIGMTTETPAAGV